MTPVLQVLVGFGLGLIGALLLTPLAIGYASNWPQNSRRNKNREIFVSTWIVKIDINNTSSGIFYRIRKRLIKPTV